MKNSRSNIRWLTQLALLVAIMLVMSYTPLGYLPLGPLNCSLLSIPVAIGAMTMGPSAGAILGGVFGVLNLLFYYWLGNALARVWGDFRMTVFFVLGILGAWASCLLVGYATPDAIFMSMLFAYTWLWPEQTALLFGVIPFKMKYLGWLELFFWAVNFLTGSLAVKVSLVLGLAGFLAFYGQELVVWCKDTLAAQKRRRDWENRNR